MEPSEGLLRFGPRLGAEPPPLPAPICACADQALASPAPP